MVVVGQTQGGGGYQQLLVVAFVGYSVCTHVSVGLCVGMCMLSVCVGGDLEGQVMCAHFPQ